MSLTSWARFLIGIALSAEIIRQLILGNEISSLSTILAIIFLILSGLYFVEKLFLKR